MIFFQILSLILGCGCLILGLLNGLPREVESWIEQLLLIRLIEKIKYAFNIVYVVLLGTLPDGTDGAECSLAVRAELVVLGNVLCRVLGELKEACRVVIIVRVAEVIELAAERVLNELLLLCRVFTRMDIELAGRGF